MLGGGGWGAVGWGDGSVHVRQSKQASKQASKAMDRPTRIDRSIGAPSTAGWRTHMGMEGYISWSEAQMRLLAARSAAVSGDSSDLALTAQL